MDYNNIHKDQLKEKLLDNNSNNQYADTQATTNSMLTSSILKKMNQGETANKRTVIINTSPESKKEEYVRQQEKEPTEPKLEIKINTESQEAKAKPSKNFNKDSPKSSQVSFTKEVEIETFHHKCDEQSKIKAIYLIKYSAIKIFFFIIMNILTAGLINFVIAWFRKLNMVFMYSKTNNIEEASFVYIVDSFGNIIYTELITSQPYYNFKNMNINKTKIVVKDNEGGEDSDPPPDTYRFRADPSTTKLTNNSINMNLTTKQLLDGRYFYFEHNFFKYIYNDQTNKFNPLIFEVGCKPNSKKRALSTHSALDTSSDKGSFTKKDLHCLFAHGLTIKDHEILKFLYGECDLNIKITSIAKLLWIEVVDPIYLFQVAAIISWFFNYYVSYACVILATTVISLILSIYETRTNLKNVQAMAKYSINIKAIRERKLIEISSEELVPGDLIVVPDTDIIVPCDVILLSGTVILNEALLTGESIPVVKDGLPLDETPYNSEDDKKHVLFCGTKVIQRRGTCLAVVINTGFNTEKGSMIRSILYPKPVVSKLESQSTKYIMVMWVIATIGFGVSLLTLYSSTNFLAAVYIYVDLLTTLVPPILPVCINIGISYAIRRLKQRGINCIDRTRVNLTGMTNLICLDKTGTLTEDHLDIVGFKRNTLTTNGFKFSRVKNDFTDLSGKVYERAVNILKGNFVLENNLNSNHSMNNQQFGNKNANAQTQTKSSEIFMEKEQEFNVESRKSLYEQTVFLEHDGNGNPQKAESEDTQQEYVKIPSRNDEMMRIPTRDIDDNKTKSYLVFEEKSNIMDRLFVECMATCHSLTKIKGKLIGDPIDIGMFEKSTWQLNQTEEDEKETRKFSHKKHKATTNSAKDNFNNIYKIEDYASLKNSNQFICTNVLPKQERTLEEKLNELPNFTNSLDLPDNEDEERILKTHYEMGIIRKFNFSSKLQRMTIIAKNLIENDICLVYSKGSPEKISEMCKKETLPEDFQEVMNFYTTKGYRVMAMAGKAMKIDYINALNIDRSLLEKNMIFLGLIIIQNKLKPMTIPTIKLLEECNLKMLMATGDNLLTAVAVARECGLIKTESNVFLCTANSYIAGEDMNKTKISNEIKNKNNHKHSHKLKYRLEWDAYDDTFIRQKQENKLKIEKINYSIKNIIEEETNYFNISQSQRSSLYSNFKRDVVENNVIQFYKFLEADESYNNLFSDGKNFNSTIDGNTKPTLDKEHNNMNESTYNENIVVDDINIGVDTSVISVEINLENIPFEYKKNHEDNIVVVTNGSTFEMLHTLSNLYKTTNDKKYKIYFDTFRIILKKGHIFARMSPDQKTLLVETMQQENFKVCMCGDGANDCGALRAATVGISLSLEEASIAAPFTSRTPDISCLKDLLLECKASMVTSFQCFKFNMLFSITMFIATVMMNSISSYITNNQYMASDMLIQFPLALLLAQTETSDKLNKYFPVNSLFAVTVLGSVVLHSIVNGLVQFGIWYLMTKMSYFKPGTCGFIGVEMWSVPCTEETVIFLTTLIQYMIAIVIVSFVKHFKKQLYDNFLLLGYLIIWLSYITYAILHRDWTTKHLLDLVEFDDYRFNYIVLAIFVGNILIAVIIEFVIIKYVASWWTKRRFKKMIKKIAKLEEEQNDPEGFEKDKERFPLEYYHRFKPERKYN